ncbi:hypothetical protein OG455_22875 [Kitasatospora sp. NBC_01287]|uniref:hypothetical protein n=1 Tax=Kitasatospora sp. NBC_01287 TaxID=2903573 RepID=UPI00225B598B|nr:hypothetical protein [Kitasatospora sp. NBC_01287]MCX4748323.1 hypothetical protein [Kitasatospora sp. NBC_01287]
MRKLVPLLATGLLAAVGFLLAPAHALADTGSTVTPPPVPAASPTLDIGNGCC